MGILGLHINAGQTAASLLENGQFVCAAAEERFVRIKQSRAFPKEAIKYCLKQSAARELQKLQGIAISWNPAENMRNINLSGFTQWRRYDPEWLYIVPNQLMSMINPHSFESGYLKMDFGTDRFPPIYFVEHHRSHLAHAICQSPFEKGLALVADEYGEFYSVTIATFNSNGFKIIKRIAYPHSLGVFYAALTELLGFIPNSDEWKLMGAAAYGNAEKYAAKLEKLIQWDEENGEWVIDTRYIEHSNMKRAGYLNERMIGYIGIPVRRTDEELTQKHFDLAAAAQAIFERRLFELIEYYAHMTGETQLAAAGGCFMNSSANGKIIANTPIERVFIPYAAADNGGAMGAALYVWHFVLNNLRTLGESISTPFLGPNYSEEQIKRTLIKYKLPYQTVPNPATYGAEQIAAGKLVGWFQGKLEFGERALGNRSILADPRNADMKDRINSAVKYREAFRPFAPSVIAEHATEFFEMPPGVSVPYMEQVYPVRAEKKHLIPAVVHKDGTGRVQMVYPQMNPIFYELIETFGKLTGVPVVLNTSFNVQGEPIICSPTDALRTFHTCGLDVLIMGSFVIKKNPS
jgi:carbamoyltransferase